MEIKSVTITWIPSLSIDSFQIMGFPTDRLGERRMISFDLESRHQVNLKTLYPVDRVMSLLKDGAELQERMR